MINTVFATKIAMSQAWTTTGKRVAVTRCRVGHNMVVAELPVPAPQYNSEATTNLKKFQIGYGPKKFKNVTKPLRTIIEKSGFSLGASKFQGIDVLTNDAGESPIKVGETVKAQQVLTVGDVVKVQGVSKGRGFAGAIKRHGFHGGPKTHGQSDRARAVGSIGAGTTPGRVWKGKKMPGHYGAENKSVTGLVVLHVDEANQEVWISGPVPGHMSGLVRIMKTGQKKSIELDKAASGVKEVSAPVAESSEAPSSEVENKAPETKEESKEAKS